MNIHGIILTDNTYNDTNKSVGRGHGAHRIAHHLRNFGYNIEVIDYCLRWSFADLERCMQRMVSSSTVFIGVGSSLFVDQDEFNCTLVKIKEKYPNISIVLGGTNLLSRSMPCIDYYVEGYAESSMLALLECLVGKKSLSTLKFSNFITSKKLIDSNKDYPVHDTSDLSIQYLESDFISNNQTLGMETARGCIFKCKFCTYSLIGKKKIDYIRTSSSIIDEIKRNYDKWGVTRYFITEDTFNDSIEKLDFLASAISSLPFKIEVTSYARLDLILAKPRSIDLLKAIGLRGVHFGIETFNAAAGKVIGKGLTGQKLKDGILWWLESMPEVSTFCSMIVGLPNDTDDLYESNKWIMQSGIHSWSWAPLYITDLTKTIHYSEFSKNYKDYGLEVLSESEVDAYFEAEMSSDFFNKNKHQTYANKAFRQKMVFWKNVNTGQTYFDAAQLAQKLNNEGTAKLVPSWTAFDWASLGYNLDEIFKWGWYNVVPPVPEEDLAKRIKNHISQYINKKINFDYESFYSNRKNKKIIPITKI